MMVAPISENIFRMSTNTVLNYECPGNSRTLTKSWHGIELWMPCQVQDFDQAFYKVDAIKTWFFEWCNRWMKETWIAPVCYLTSSSVHVRSDIVALEWSLSKWLSSQLPDYLKDYLKNGWCIVLRFDGVLCTWCE